MNFTFRHFLIVFIIVLFVTVGFATLVNKGYMNGFLSQFSAKSAMDGLANSSWPMTGHDKFHTGQTSVNGPQSNNTKWTFGLWANSPPVIGSDGTIYILGRPNNETPTINSNSSTTDNITDNASVNSSNGGNFLFAINPNGTLKWEANTTFGYSMSSLLIAADGTIYISADNTLYAVTENGSTNWEYTPEGGVGDISSTIASDGTVYFTYNDKLYAVNPNGTLKWETNKLNFEVKGIPTVYPDGTIYCICGDSLGNGMGYAFNPDGTLKLNFSFEEAGFTPTIGSDGTIYFASDDSFSSNNYFYAVNPNGTLKWKFPIDGNFELPTPSVASAAIAADGTIYAAAYEGDTQGIVYAFNPDGTLKWKYLTDTEEPITSSFAVDSNGTIYFISGSVYALNPNGTVKWQSNINNPGQYGYLAIGPDGTLYATTETSGYLYAIGN